MPTRSRIGVLTPSLNTAVEPITSEIGYQLKGNVSFHYNRFPVTQMRNDEETRAQFDAQPIVASAKLLLDCRPDVMIWNGTSGGFLGVDSDRGLKASVEEAIGIPFSTTMLAMLEALDKFEATSIALASPYSSEVHEIYRRSLHEEGLTCFGSEAAGISNAVEMNDVTIESVEDHVRRVYSPDVDAVLIVCTNYPGAYVVEKLEQELAVPVLDSTSATVWKGLRMAGVTDPVAGWGRLLRDDF